MLWEPNDQSTPWILSSTALQLIPPPAYRRRDWLQGQLLLDRQPNPLSPSTFDPAEAPTNVARAGAYAYDPACDPTDWASHL